ncbi:hypothetical protein KKG22_01660 [Patescibacteria group bacterium]|nr:hypothetical protein [Patescibacteria group bacterium]MBU1721957.1 hypothetical protein [Patescibacteria group bacterium]MBU1901778.1 hypothetical protein [Patescibacteria group bacterium]
MNKKYILPTALMILLLTGSGCSMNTKKVEQIPIQPTPTPIVAEVADPIEKEKPSTVTAEVTIATSTEKAPAEVIETEPAPPVVVVSPKPAPVACGTDTSCLQKHIQNCLPATGEMTFLVQTFGLIITDNGQTCTVRHTAKSGFEGEFASWIGEYFDCSFDKATLKANPEIYTDAFIDPINQCSGPYVDLMKSLDTASQDTTTKSTKFIGIDVGKSSSVGDDTFTIVRITDLNSVTFNYQSKDYTITPGETKIIGTTEITLDTLEEKTCKINGEDLSGLECHQTLPYKSTFKVLYIK